MTLERMTSLFGEDRALIAEICLIFLQEARNTLAKIESALEAGEANSAMKLAHTLKGSAANVGADEVSALAWDVEKSVAAGEGDNALILLQALGAALDETAGFLRAELGI